ncbi:MAG: transglutaminase-like domain-containing protein [Sphingomonadales bacterium]|jgi:regulator of sirC expression with transglutaminase-like and TPR domain
MISDSELKAMLYLLDDTDEQVVNTVSGRLLSEGTQILPLLEEYWLSNQDPLRANRIEQIIRNIQNKDLSAGFDDWLKSKENSLLEACLLVSKIHYPGLDESLVVNFVEKIRLDAWMSLYNASNPHDKISILNHIFFERYNFKGNSNDYHNPDNSLINRVIETRSGNPISLCNLYAIVAQKLGLPVFGVNLPQHFVLAYCDDTHMEPVVPFQAPPFLKREDYGQVLFYINPFSRGQIFLHKNIKEFLQVIKVESQPAFFDTCPTVEILKRMLRNLHYAYQKSGEGERTKLVSFYMKKLGMTDESSSEE